MQHWVVSLWERPLEQGSLFGWEQLVWHGSLHVVSWWHQQRAPCGVLHLACLQQGLLTFLHAFAFPLRAPATVHSFTGECESCLGVNVSLTTTGQRDGCCFRCHVTPGHCPVPCPLLAGHYNLSVHA